MSRIAGFILAIAIAASVTYVAFSAELFGHKRAIMHRAYIFGIFVPIFLSAIASFFLALSPLIVEFIKSPFFQEFINAVKCCSNRGKPRD